MQIRHRNSKSSLPKTESSFLVENKESNILRSTKPYYIRQRKNMSLFIIDSIVIWRLLQFLLFAVFVIAALITKKLFHPPWYDSHKSSLFLHDEVPENWLLTTKEKTPKSELDLNYENVEFDVGPITNPNNKKLRGWLISPPKFSPSKSSLKKVGLLIAHGGGRDRRQHLRHVPALQKLYPNMYVLLYDNQEHGLSDGKGRGMGWFTFEGSDAYAAAKYLKNELEVEKVIAMGSSFGGAAVLVASGFFDAETKYIDGVISENPPSSHYDLIYHTVHDLIFSKKLHALLSMAIARVCWFMMKCIQGFPNLPTPLQIVSNIAPRPLLISHGFDDIVVPFQQGLDIYNAAKHENKDYLWVAKCGHGMIFDVDFMGWNTKIGAVIKQVLNS